MPMANGQIDWQRYQTDPAYKAEADRMIAEQSRRFSRGHKTIFDEIAAQMPSPASAMGAGQSPWSEEELRATGQTPRLRDTPPPAPIEPSAPMSVPSGGDVTQHLKRLISERLNEGLDAPHTPEERQQAEEFLQSHPARDSREALHRRNLSNIEARGASIPDVSAMHGYRTEGGGLDMAAIENASVPLQRMAGREDARYNPHLGPFGVSGHRPARLDAEPQFASATVRNRALRGELPAGAPDPGSPTFTAYLRDKIGINPDAFGKYMRRLEESDVAFTPSADTPVSGAASNFRLRGSSDPLTGDALADRRREVGSIVDTMKQRMQERLDEGRSNLAQRQQPAGDSGNDWVSLVQRAAALKRMGVSDEGVKFMLTAALSERQSERDFGQRKDLLNTELGARTSEAERGRNFESEQARLARMAEDARAAERRAFDAQMAQTEAQLRERLAAGDVTARRELAELEAQRQAERDAAAAEERRRLAAQDAAVEFAGSQIAGGNMTPADAHAMLPEDVRAQIPAPPATAAVQIERYNPTVDDPFEYLDRLFDQGADLSEEDLKKLAKGKGVTDLMLQKYIDSRTPGFWTGFSDFMPVFGDNDEERKDRWRRLNQARIMRGLKPRTDVSEDPNYGPL